MKRAILFRWSLLMTTFMAITNDSISQSEFITRWKIESSSIKINVNGVMGTYNYGLKWKKKGESTFIGDLTNQNLAKTIDVSAFQGDTIEVHITGTFPYFWVNQTDNDPQELIEILQWGSLQLKSGQQSFKNCSNLRVLATDSPNLSQVQSVYEMFAGCSNLNSNFNSWNVGNIKYFNYMFSGCTSFNQPLNNWNMVSALETDYMFNGCHAFNQPLNNWNVSNVTNMSGMFRQTYAFNQPLNNWNVSKVTTMKKMFEQTQAFNQDIQSWNLAVCTDLSEMFKSSKAFNAPLNNLNVSNVKTFHSMFYGAEVFNQPLNNWTFSSSDVILTEMFAYSRKFVQPLDEWTFNGVINMNYMFFATDYPYCTMDQNLNAWAQLYYIPSGVQFFANRSVASNNAKSTLQTQRTWTFITNVLVDLANTPISITYPNGLCASNTNNIIQANGSTGFSWSTGQTGASIPVPNNTPGTYTISVTDNCGNSSGNLSYTIGEDQPNVSLGPDLLLCTSDYTTTFTLTATGAQTYLWQGDMNYGSSNTKTYTINNDQTLTFIVKGRSVYGCEDADTIVVTKKNLPLHQYTFPPQSICEGEEVELLSDAISGTLREWNIYDQNNNLLETYTTANATFQTPIVNASTVYNGTLDFTFSNGCEKGYTFTFTATDCTLGMKDATNDPLTVFPNPATHSITISGVEMEKVEIINLLGAIVYSNENVATEQTIDVQHLESGMYLLKVNGSISKKIEVLN